MPIIHGLPQALTGNELVTIYQEQNGQLAICSMQLSQLISLVNFDANNWAANLPTAKPMSAGIVWNNSGIISIS